MLMNQTRFADCVTFTVGLMTASDQTVRAVHSCNNWFNSTISRVLLVMSKRLVIDQLSFSLFFIGQNTGRKFTGNDRNGHNYRIRLDRAGRA